MCLSQIHMIHTFLSRFVLLLFCFPDSQNRFIRGTRSEKKTIEQLRMFFSQSQVSGIKPENNVPKTVFCKIMLFPMNFPVYLSGRKLNFTQIEENRFCLASIWEFGKHLQCFKRKFVAFNFNLSLFWFSLVFHKFHKILWSVTLKIS